MKVYFLGGKYKDVYLTEREAQCMQLLLRGHTYRQIGDRLKLSPRTIEFYVNNMKAKLRVRSRSQLVAAVSDTEFAKSVKVEDIIA